ncbi:MAG TPA: hypothetical protein VFT22_02775, partial [Kofleriaceae bacterium]|nr:hypothetical protein [Kofleriaceae bacterium]
MALRLGLPRTCAYWLAFRAALVARLGSLLAGGSPAEHGAAGRQSLRLLRLRHGLFLFLER